MKHQSLDDESRRAIVKYKLQRADETLSDARGKKAVKALQNFTPSN